MTTMTTEKKTRSQIGKSSRERGKAFELELVHYFNDRGYHTRRGQQYSGHNGDADVVGLPGIHIEAKFRENLNVRAAIGQAVKDAKRDCWGKLVELPTVFWKKARQGTVVIMRLGDWMELLGYMHDFKRLTTWHHTDFYGQPPEPPENIWNIGEVPPDQIWMWLHENFTPYLAWPKGVKRPWCYFYAGDYKWVTADGKFVKDPIVLWKELPRYTDMDKLTPHVDDGEGTEGHEWSPVEEKDG